MMTPSDLARVYETVLAIPGMNDQVKLDLKISRKNVLLLNSVLERGLNAKDDDKTSLLSSMPPEAFDELKLLTADMLQRAQLGELMEKLSSFGTAK